MKITVIIPLLNEEKTIIPLLHALEKQTLLPTKVILVDGGSKDNTLQAIQNYVKKRKKLNIELITTKNTNRSQARNIGIQKTTTDIIAVTDAGCIPKKNWLKNITQPYKDDSETQVVAGFYDPQPQSSWENVIANVTCTREWSVDEHTFLPSSRSLSFTKVAWKKVNGYPEHLETCEDIIFAERLRKYCINQQKKHSKNSNHEFSSCWKVQKNAQVVWKQHTDIFTLHTSFFHYAVGDLKANYERHIKKIHRASWRISILVFFAIPSIFIPYIKFIGIGLLILYLVGSLYKHQHVLTHPFAFFQIPCIQFLVDVSLFQAWIYSKLTK